MELWAFDSNKSEIIGDWRQKQIERVLKEDDSDLCTLSRVELLLSEYNAKL